MNTLVRLIASALVILASGCANVTELKRDLSAKNVTVTEFPQMQFEALVPGQPRTITLDSESPTFSFAEGKSYFSATSLPQTSGPRFITFQSDTSGPLMNMMNVMIPRFAFLDSSKQLLRTESATQIRRNTDRFRGTFFEGRVPVPQSAAYAVVFASDKTEHPLIAFSANGTRWPVPLAPAGKTRVSVTTQAVATIADSGFSETDTRAQLFMVAEVDGQSIPNASSESSQASSGAGFRLTTLLTSREVPARALKLKLVGTHKTGAPIQSLLGMAAGNFFSVTGVVDFTPSAGVGYVVKGELKKEGSSIWIEDATTGRHVTEKVIAH